LELGFGLLITLVRLFIDTSSNKKTIVRLGNRTVVRKSSVWRSQVVLPMIASLLRCQGCTLAAITEIEVATGASLPAGERGSFTGLRVGAAVANALGFTLSIPVNGEREVFPVYEV
jgi:tRNA A37 threonylcarbamoyladenosine modification protein TsaB